MLKNSIRTALAFLHLELKTMTQTRWGFQQRFYSAAIMAEQGTLGRKRVWEVEILKGHSMTVEEM